MAKKSTTVRTKQRQLQFLRAGARLSSRLAPPLAARWLERLFLTPTRRSIRPHEHSWMAHAIRSELAFDPTRQLPIYTWTPPPADAGTDAPLVLLVHGWSGSASQMAVYAAPLVARGFRVVAFDAPAHGDAGGDRTGLPELAVAIERVAAHVGPVHAVIAHSLGSAATTVALSRGLEVQRLVYLAPPDDPRHFLQRAAQFVGFAPAIVPRAQRRIERRYGILLEQLEGGRLAPAIHAPLLVAHDQTDREVPYEQGARLVAAWPDAQLIATNGLGHNRIVSDHQIVDAGVRFIANRAAALRAA
jgi:pimeloyl-ACP methyl ester carboxylesterase